MDQILEEARAKAQENFRRGLNCGECVVRALIDTEACILWKRFERKTILRGCFFEPVKNGSETILP